jgi:carnosine N-methyltransferase
MENNNNNSNNLTESKNEEEEEDNELHETIGPIGLNSSSNDPEEFNHLKNIVSSFFNYQVDSLRDVSRIERDFSSIPLKYKERMSFNYQTRIEKLKSAIWENYKFLLDIAEPYKEMFKSFKSSTGEILIEPLFVKPKNIIKLRSTLKLFIRDWSKEGLFERKKTYEPILTELKEYFSNKSEKDFEKGIHILNPGAGLGRLMYEIAKLGFKSQGNEFSYHMLLSSNYILNNSTKENEFFIQPLIHSFSNLINEEIPFKKIYIPDECLSDNLIKSKYGEMSMVAGEFIRVYKKNVNFWDGIVTCFFLDTANNVIEYIETISEIIKTNGIWINIGPLLYHYTEMENEISIELSWDEIKKIIIGYGFEIKKEEYIKTTYSSYEESLMQTVYNCIFFVAIKK